MNRDYFCASIAVGLALSGGDLVSGQPVLLDARLKVEQVAQGLSGGVGQLVTSIVFVDPDTILAVRRGDGKILRIDLVPGQSVTAGPQVADLDIISPTASDSQTEYGVQGMCVHPGFATNRWIYIRYDRAQNAGSDTLQSTIATLPNFSASTPTQSVIDRFVWDPSANAGAGALTFDLRILSTTIDTRYHHGGAPRFAPDGTLIASVGDLRHVTWIAGHSGLMLSSNYAGGISLDAGVFLRLNDDGTIPASNPWASGPAGAERWFGYGTRNSFGIDFDPLTGALWATDNGESTFDEVNLVAPGFNGGHGDIMGPVGHPSQPGNLSGLVNLPGSQYADPKFSWLGTIGVTGIRHLYASALGPAFNDAVLVGGVNQGFLWLFRLNAARNAFTFTNPGLQDAVHDVADGYANPTGTEGQELLIGTGFGTTFAGTISITLGHDRLPYVLTGNGRIYRISPVINCPLDCTGDYLIDTSDLVTLLGRFGSAVVPYSPGDFDGNGTIDTSDLVLLLSQFGEDCTTL